MRNELKVGLAVLFAAVVLYFGVRFLQDQPLFGGGYRVVAVFDDAQGLSEGAFVRLNGVTAARGYDNRLSWEIVSMGPVGKRGADELDQPSAKRLKMLEENAIAAGVDQSRIILDPGIGFGKTAPHNLEIMRRLDEFSVLGRPLLVGMSRKSTIGYVLDLRMDERVEGTAATVALSIAGGADIVRVHDVREMVRVARMSDAIVRGWP